MKQNNDELENLRKFILTIDEAGGCVFKHQIEVLWSKYGGRIIYRRLAQNHLIIEGKWSQYGYIALNEKARQLLECGNGEESLFGKVGNKFNAVKRTQLSDLIITTSALKFAILADAVSLDTEQEMLEFFKEKGVGKIGYKANLFGNIEEYAKLSYPNFLSDEQNFSMSSTYDGQKFVKYKVFTNSDKYMYESIVNSVTNKSLALFNSTKIVITPISDIGKINISYGQEDSLNVCIFDTGIEKTARKYVNLLLKYSNDLGGLSIKTITINAYGHSEDRMDSFKDEFETYLKSYPNKFQQKTANKKNWNTGIKFVMGEFVPNKILQKIMGGKVMDAKKQNDIIIDKKLKKDAKAKIKFDAQHGIITKAFNVVLETELLDEFERATNTKNPNAIIARLIKQYLKETDKPAIAEINLVKPTLTDLSELLSLLLIAKENGNVKKIDYEKCICLDEFLQSKIDKPQQINLFLFEISKIANKLKEGGLLTQSELKVMDRINMLVENIEPGLVAHDMYLRFLRFSQENLGQNDGIVKFEATPKILIHGKVDQFVRPTAQLIFRRDGKEVNLLIEVIHGDVALLHILAKLEKYEEYYQNYTFEGRKPVVMFVAEKESTLLKINEQMCISRHNQLKGFTRYTTDKLLAENVLGEAFCKVVDYKLEMAPLKILKVEV